MSVLVGLSRSAEGAVALERGAQEAQLRGEALLVIELEPRAASAVALPQDAELLVQQDHQDPVQGLLDAAASRSASLVVVGTRRRSPVGKFLLGSWAQRVILDAEVPVLVVKTPPA